MNQHPITWEQVGFGLKFLIIGVTIFFAIGSAVEYWAIRNDAANLRASIARCEEWGKPATAIVLIGWGANDASTTYMVASSSAERRLGLLEDCLKSLQV